MGKGRGDSPATPCLQRQPGNKHGRWTAGPMKLLAFKNELNFCLTLMEQKQYLPPYAITTSMLKHDLSREEVFPGYRNHYLLSI